VLLLLDYPCGWWTRMKLLCRWAIRVNKLRRLAIGPSSINRNRGSGRILIIQRIIESWWWEMKKEEKTQLMKTKD
jgi:hypothetical protein